MMKRWHDCYVWDMYPSVRATKYRCTSLQRFMDANMGSNEGHRQPCPVMFKYPNLQMMVDMIEQVRIINFWL